MNANNVVNAVLFQITWFACVLGAAAKLLWPGLLALAVLVFSLRRRPGLGIDLTLAGLAVAVGFALDSLWIRSGVLDYQGARWAPAWILALWAGVALTLRHSLSLFLPRPVIGGVLAGCCAPLSYLAGERFGAATVPDAWDLIWVSLCWAVLFTISFAVIARLRPADGGKDTASDDGRRYEYAD